MNLTRNRVAWGFFATVLVAGFLGACGSGGDDGTDKDGGGDKGGEAKIEVTVDDSLEPELETLAKIDGSDAERRAAVVVDGDGNRTEFVEREIMVPAADRSAAKKVAERMDGEIITRVTPDSLPKDAEHVFIIRLETLKAGADEVEQSFREATKDSHSWEVRFSSEKGLKTLAAAMREARTEGTEVAPNWILQQDEAPTKKSIEAEMSDSAKAYGKNALHWPYFTHRTGMFGEGTPGFGVDKAWEIIAALGAKAEKVPMVVIDGGFLKSDDMPDDAEIIPEGIWGTRNPGECTGGSKCPWHGTKVSGVAFGTPDNKFGIAGPAGPVAKPLMMQVPTDDVGSFFKFAFDTVPALVERSRVTGSHAVINISAGTGIPGGVCITGICKVAGKIARAANKLGYLIVTSAGNKGKDVDKRKGGKVISWEATKYVPCELGGVVCVGGLDWDSRERHGDSNYGTDGGVDIYGPYLVWVPKISGRTVENIVKIGGGTSYSSPFVAGIAALVWSAAPGLSPGDVRSTLIRTQAAASSKPPRVDAHDALLSVTDPFDPVVEITSPKDGAMLEKHVDADTFFLTDAFDPDGFDRVTIAWKSDKDGPFMPRAWDQLSTGTHRITATGTDEKGRTGEDSIEVTIDDPMPTIQIHPPRNSSSIERGSIIPLEATTSDPGREDPLPAANVSWEVDGKTDGLAPVSGGKVTGRMVTLDTSTLTVGNHQIKATVTDGESNVTDQIRIGVATSPDNDPPPTARILRPKVGEKFNTRMGDSMGAYAEVELCAYGINPEPGKTENLFGEDVVWYVKEPGGTFQEIGTDPGPGKSNCLKHKFRDANNGAGTTFELRVKVTEDGGDFAWSMDRKITVYNAPI